MKLKLTVISCLFIAFLISGLSFAKNSELTKKKPVEKEKVEESKGNQLIINLMEYSPSAEPRTIPTKPKSISKVKILSAFRSKYYEINRKIVSGNNPLVYPDIQKASTQYEMGTQSIRTQIDNVELMTETTNKLMEMLNMYLSSSAFDMAQKNGGWLESEVYKLVQNIIATQNKLAYVMESVEYDPLISNELDYSNQVLSRAEDLIEDYNNVSVKEIEFDYDLSEGEYIIVTIERYSNSHKTDLEAEWHFVYDTRTRGSWAVSYGFILIDDIISRKYRFYSLQEEDQYVIQRTRDNRLLRDLDSVPAVFFSYMPKNSILRSMNFGISAGIGLKEKFAVFGGFHCCFHDNVFLHGGVSFFHRPILKEGYSVDQVIKEKLDHDQLTRNEIAVNPYIAISFRFSKNPFSNSKETKK